MKRKNKLLSVILMAIVVMVIGRNVRADEPVTLDLSNGNIDITPTGYLQGNGSEVPYTGTYNITGSRTDDSPLDIINNSGDTVTFNINLNNAQIIASTWATAVRINGNSPVIINIVNSGNSEIRGYNHAAMDYQGTSTATVNITNPVGETLVLKSVYPGTPHVYYPENGSIVVTVNGVTPGNNSGYRDHSCSYQPLWTPDVESMTKEEFTGNQKEIKLQLVCACGAAKPEVTSFEKNYEDPTCTRSTTGHYIATVDGISYESPQYTLIGSHSLREVPAKEATCTENGNQAYWICNNCNKLFSGADASTEIALENTVIEKTTHSINPDWKADETSHWKVCAECGLKEDESIHIYGKWIVKKNATAAKTGSKERICSVCGYKEIKEIPAKSDKLTAEEKSPQTGDSTDWMIWLVLMVVSASMLLGDSDRIKKQ